MVAFLLGEVVVVIGDVWDADDKDSHFAGGSVDDAGWDVDEAAFLDGVLLTVQGDAAFSIEDVVELCGAFVVVGACAVDIHGMRPGGGVQGDVFMADEAVSPAAGAAFSGGVSFMPDEGGGLVGGGLG